MEKPQQAYWGVIPGELRTDDTLPANAKLLYVDISTLTNQRGYCFASNEYLAGLYGWTERSVQRMIAALARRGYIQVEMVQGHERRIYAGAYLGRPPDGASSRGGDKIVTPDKKVVGGTTKLSPPNNVDIDSTNFPPISPQGGKSRPYQLDDGARKLLNDYVRGDPELADVMVSFMEVRVAKKAVNSARAIKALLNELDRLSQGDRTMKLRIINQSIANSWKSVFPLSSRACEEGTSGTSVDKPGGDGGKGVVRSDLPQW